MPPIKQFIRLRRQRGRRVLRRDNDDFVAPVPEGAEYVLRRVSGSERTEKRGDAQAKSLSPLMRTTVAGALVSSAKTSISTRIILSATVSQSVLVRLTP